MIAKSFRSAIRPLLLHLRRASVASPGVRRRHSRMGRSRVRGYQPRSLTPDRLRSRERVRDWLYNGFEQLISRVITNSGTANGTVFSVHDVFGNVIAELNAAGATVREYIWLPEAEIAPTMGSRTVVDRPMAVVSGVNTTPTLLMVHVDHPRSQRL
jgi:hypothetical protein